MPANYSLFISDGLWTLCTVCGQWLYSLGVNEEIKISSWDRCSWDVTKATHFLNLVTCINKSTHCLLELFHVKAFTFLVIISCEQTDTAVDYYTNLAPYNPLAPCVHTQSQTLNLAPAVGRVLHTTLISGRRRPVFVSSLPVQRRHKSLCVLSLPWYRGRGKGGKWMKTHCVCLLDCQFILRPVKPFSNFVWVCCPLPGWAGEKRDDTSKYQVAKPVVTLLD